MVFCESHENSLKMGDHALNQGLMNSLQHQENQNNFYHVFTLCTRSIVQHYYCLHANCEVCVRVIEGWPAHCGNISFIHTRSNRSFGEEGRKRVGRLMGWEVAFSGKDGNEKRTLSLSHNKTPPSGPFLLPPQQVHIVPLSHNESAAAWHNNK